MCIELDIATTQLYQSGRCQLALEKRSLSAERLHAMLLRWTERYPKVGTLTETLACWDAAREGGYRAIVSARSGETEDVSIVHLAIGWGVPQLKVGSFSRSERMAKWNEAIRIEEFLGARAMPYPARKLFRK